jgi:hypothetical protein
MRNRENRYRLSIEEIEVFGFNINKTRRYRLTDEQVEQLFKMREANVMPVSIGNKTISNTPDKESSPFVLNAWNQETGKMFDIDEYCEFYNLPRNDIKDYKLITHTGTPYYNIKFKDKELDIEEIDLKEVISHLLLEYENKPNTVHPDTYETHDYCDRLIISDIHIGMNPDTNENSLYGLEWNREKLMDRANEMLDFILNNQTGNHLVIDDLGDFLDGWDGYTTRGGHALPQNMTNKEAFDCAVNFKLHLLRELSGAYDTVKMHNICNDNHSGSFGEIVNHTIMMMSRALFNNVEVRNMTKFIEHYYLRDFCFILSHGKDNKNLKYGFKPQMDGKQLEKIDQYIKNNGIYNKAAFIEFSKGDSHQALFDMCSSDDFDYMNYPAFSPSSEWVQTNFKKGRSGFVMQILDLNEGTKDIKPYFFHD